MRSIMKTVKNKKIILIISSLVLVAAILLNLSLLCQDVFRKGGGVVTKISATGIDTITLKLNYVAASGYYSVRNVPLDEEELTGDGSVAYDGKLGKYRIAISFGDASPSTAVKWKMAISNTLKRHPAKLEMKIVYPADHGFLLYVGSDTPISVAPVEQGVLNQIGGTIPIPITVG